jgi:hypothetical protein
MALSVNPLAKLVTSVSSSISTASSQAGAAFSSASSELGKLKLDQTAARLSGEVGSALSGFKAGLPSNLGNIPGAGNLGGIAANAQSLVSKVGTAAGSISNITADIAGSINKITGGGLASGLLDAATKISSVAGQINNLLSLKRAGNLPSNGELFASRGAVVQMTPVPANDWRVRVSCNWDLFKSPLFNDTIKPTEGVVWPYLPNITLSSKANYTQIDPIHNVYPFNAYKNSQIDDITISGDFTCETETDAYYWIGATTFFRTVTKMFYGSSEFQGNPPPVCQLTGYGSSVFNTVPVVVKSFSVDFKDDVNYIKCSIGQVKSPTWVPIISTVSVVLTPIYNRSRLRQFSLQDFAAGKTVGYL